MLFQFTWSFLFFSFYYLTRLDFTFYPPTSLHSTSLLCLLSNNLFICFVLVYLRYVGLVISWLR